MTGDVFYYDATTGSRLDYHDSDCTPEYAQQASNATVIAEWCERIEGKPRGDVRYFKDGNPITVAEAHIAVPYTGMATILIGHTAPPQRVSTETERVLVKNADADPDECATPETCGTCHVCQKPQPCPEHPRSTGG